MEEIANISLNKCNIDFGEQKLFFPKFNIDKKEFPFKIIGQNGSGKSSLTLALTNCIPDYIKGIVDVDFTITTTKGNFCIPENQKLFRIIPQKWKYGLLGFSPIEEIQVTQIEDKDWLNEMLNDFEIEKLNRISSMFLSDGEKKRIIICKTLVSLPSLIISDEWATHLDAYWIDKINGIFKKYYNKGGVHLELLSSGVKNEKCLFLPNININNLVSSFDNINYSFIDNYLNSCSFKRINEINGNFSYVSHNTYKKINVNAKSGELLFIIGGNGAGKTTLLKNIWKDSFFFFRKIKKRTFVRSNILYIPTEPIYHILGPTIRDEYERILGTFIKNEAKDFFEALLGLNVDSDVFILSFGQRKVFSIILGLLSDYNIIAIDEIFAGLDERNQRIVFEVLKRIQNYPKIIIIADQEKRFELTSKILYI